MKYKDIPDMSWEQRERFLSSFTAADNDSCWKWTSRKNKPGYGLFKFNGTEYYSHRIAYHLWGNDLSNELVLDHICRNKSCINNKHLRQVTNSVNVKENTISPCFKNSIKTHCKYGHEFTKENTLQKKDGRRCRTCKRSYEKMVYYRCK